ncbi:MAG: DUF2332 domain-containing protein [Rhizobacter sp.]|nr:DUF2332 domain-containing protein [Rhizobacter sp.]
MHTPTSTPSLTATTAGLAERFRHFARVECPEEPLYQALCRILAADADLLGLLDGVPDEQQRPNLWLAAVHDSLLAGATHPLAAYYPSVGGTRAPDDALAACLRAFVQAHDPTLRECMRTRTTQTNEIGRCAVLWPALHAIARRSGRTDLALLDVGCSAGLNLGVDLYAYDDAAASAGVPRLACVRHGRLIPPAAPTPRIVQRCGIDPAPVRLDDEPALRWLRACLWPSDRVRATRFDQAVALLRERQFPVERVADCTAYVVDWLAQVPAGVQPVVFNSWVLTYFEPPALARHLAAMADLVQRTGAVWLSAEGPGLCVGPVTVPPPSSPALATGSLWTLCSRGPGGRPRFDVLARSHPHGRWVEWLDAR